MTTALKQNLFVAARSLFAAASIIATLTACSDDEPTPALAGVTSNAATVSLDREGNATLEFTVNPADAQVSGVEVTLDGDQAATASGLTHVNGGVWSVKLSVADVKQFGASRNGTLTARQADGTSATTTFVLADPFSVPEGAFTVHNPYTATFCDPTDHTSRRMPLIVTANGVDIDDVTDVKLRITDVQPNELKGADFVFGREETGEYGIFIKQDVVDAVVAKNPQQYFIVGGSLELTMNTGRVGTAPIHFMFTAPQYTYTSDKLSFNAADLLNPDYELTLTLDDTQSGWRRIGFYEGPGNTYTAPMDLSESGLYTTDGELVDDGDFFFAMPSLNDATIVTVEGDPAYRYEPGTYFFIYHVKSDWEYGGKKYPRIRADFRYQLELK